jgi:S-(hydroxymethyl)glutathione dehydrogenase/alcohol dehydrogenase
MRTRGAVFVGPHQPPRVEDLELDPPGHGEVAVRMVASGVCHSDLHVIDGEWERSPGIVMGHEGAAIVEALGPGVPERPAGAPPSPGAGLREGDLVVLAWTAPCGGCAACRRGEAWVCTAPRGTGYRLSPELLRLRRLDGTPIGVYAGIGTWGERQVVAAEAAVAIDPGTPPEIAALIGCAVTTGVGAAVDTARVRPGESVVVIGAGGVGLSVVMGAALAGASPIVAIDTEDAKLAVAEDAGATAGIIAGSDETALRAAVRKLLPGGADHVVEAIGLTVTIELAVELARPGGTVTLVGMTPQGQRAGIDVYRFVEEGKRLLGSNYGSAVPALAFPRLADLYLAGRLPLDLLVTERIGLDGIAGALDAMRRRDGARRVIRFA